MKCFIIMDLEVEFYDGTSIDGLKESIREELPVTTSFRRSFITGVAIEKILKIEINGEEIKA